MGQGREADEEQNRVFSPLFPGGQNFPVYESEREHKKWFSLEDGYLGGTSEWGEWVKTHKYFYTQTMYIFSCALQKQDQSDEDILVNGSSCDVFIIGHVHRRPTNTYTHMGTHTHSGLPTWACTSWMLASVVLSHLTVEDRVHGSAQRPLYGTT